MIPTQPIDQERQGPAHIVPNRRGSTAHDAVGLVKILELFAFLLTA
jgi:hypothetical protein